MSKHCYLCGSNQTTNFLHLPSVPTQDGIMSESARSAQSAVMGSIQLRFCQHCHYISNEGYDAEKISFATYDFSLDHSPLFRQYIDELCTHLIAKYNLQHKTILDIGCGDGEFLKTLCRMGQNKGIGIDPGFDHSKRKVDPVLDIRFVQDYYDESSKELQADFISCRLVIDLLGEPIQFLKTVRKNLDNQPNTYVFFEVPNARYTFDERIIWNVVYEHRSWFVDTSFKKLFEICGFEVIETMLLWHDEFLGIVAKPASPKPLNGKANDVAFAKSIQAFGDDFNTMLNESRTRIERIRRQQTKTIGWGAGARALTFFNLFNLTKEVPYIVDINLKRHDKYLPGSAQQIVAPKFIHTYQPELVIITNPTYAKEIKTQVYELGLSPDFWVL